MGAHIADLSDILETLQEEKKLRKTDIRRMASLLGVPNRIDGKTVRLQTLLDNVLRVFRQSVDAVQEHNLSSRGEHPAVQRIMRDVRELGRQPMELKNNVSAAERAEYKLALQVRKYKLKKRVRDMFKSLTRTQETSSGGPHPAGRVPQSAASIALPTPALLLRKRLHKKTTVLH